MSISGIGQNYYHNNVATVRNTKNVNSTGKNDGFAGKVTEKNPVSPEDMTLEEYKAYFNEKMNSLYTHPSQRNRNDIIDITDAAYKRMQTDPEYEKKILDALAKNKAVNFGNYIPQISYMHTDDTWEGCYGYTKGMKENDSYTKGISSKHENNVKKKKYITINNPQKSRKNYDLTYDNVAIPEVHTHEETYDTKSVSSDSSVDYDNLAIPEVHIKGRK